MWFCCFLLSISAFTLKLFLCAKTTPDPDELDYMELPVSIEILSPKGIRFIVKNSTLIRQFQFCLNLHKHFNATHLEYGQFNGVVYNYKEKPVIFVENADCILKKGDKVYYWYAFFDDYPLRYVIQNQSFTVVEAEHGKLIAKNTTLDDFPSNS